MAAIGTVFNIQHFTIHDGPGIRTELFLKGCPLRCRWCSNPEGFEMKPQPGIYKKKCLGEKACGLCKKACEEKGPAQDQDSPLLFHRGKITDVNRTLCTGCMACSAECPSEAIKAWGRTVTVEEAMREICRDRGYYERSGGGVTVSGGESLLQAGFVASLFQACRAEGISTCCESCLYVGWEQIQKVLPFTDLWIADLKMMDPQAHRDWTGADNAQILNNLKNLARENVELILRIPIIPKVNDNRTNMEQTADFILQEMGGKVRTLQLLSFMRLGEEKYTSLGLPYQMKSTRFVRTAFQRKVGEFADYFNKRGIHCLVGTREKEDIFCPRMPASAQQTWMQNSHPRP